MQPYKRIGAWQDAQQPGEEIQVKRKKPSIMQGQLSVSDRQFIVNDTAVPPAIIERILSFVQPEEAAGAPFVGPFRTSKVPEQNGPITPKNRYKLTYQSDYTRLGAVFRSCSSQYAISLVYNLKYPHALFFAAAAFAGKPELIRTGELNRWKWDERMCAAAARAGNFDLLMYLRARGCPWDERTTEAAAAIGRIDILEWAVKNDCPLAHSAFAAAVVHGQLEAYEWMIPHGLKWLDSFTELAIANGRCNMIEYFSQNVMGWTIPARFMDRAAFHGQIALLEWGLRKGCKLDVQVMEQAVKGGHLVAVQWLRTKGCPWNANTSKTLCEGGHLAILAWACQNQCPINYDACFQTALKKRHLHIVEWLQQTAGATITLQMLTPAAENGDIEIFTSLRSIGVPFDSRWISIARKNKRHELEAWLDKNVFRWPRGKFEAFIADGNLEAVKKMHAKAQAVNWDPKLCAIAARHGQMEVLCWLRAQGCPVNEACVEAAAYGGHLAILQALRKAGCPWHEKTLELAAMGGHTQLLFWAVSEGCPGDKTKCAQLAAEHGHEHTVKQIVGEFCLELTAELFAAAGSGGSVPLLTWLRSRQCPSDKRATGMAAQYGHLAALQWLHKNHYPWDVSGYYNAAWNGYPEIIAWAMKEDLPCSASAAIGAATSGHLDILQLLHKSYDFNDERICEAAAADGHREILAWARDNGYSWDAKTFSAAVEHEQMQTLDWLHEHKCPWDPEVYQIALSKKEPSEELLSWLHEHCPL